MGSTIIADFHGDRLLGIENERGRFVYLRPIVERLGLDWSAQLKRVKRNPTLREGMAMMATPPGYSDGNEAVFLRLDLLNGWLFTVNSARVKADLRPKLVVYQRECFKVLARAFSNDDGSPEPIATPTAAITTELALRLVAEARQSFDRYVGREVWFATGLPVTPGMRTAQYQGSLFTFDAYPNRGGRP